MIDPLLDGALDNTLGQSGYAWFQDPHNPFLDVQAPAAFRDFVDAYIYVWRRHVPLPHDVQTHLQLHEPFIALWQDGATPIPFAAAHEANVGRATLWNQFQDSVRVDTTWCRWICFQWTPEIVAAFKARVPDWKTQFEDALEEIRPAVSSLGITASNPIVKLVRQLEIDLVPAIGDRDYFNFARNRGVSPAVLAGAYAWNWFRRGALYRGRTHGMSVRFHDLRDCAVVSPNDGTSEPERFANAIPWGQILAQCIQERLIERDSMLFCDALRMVRDTVRTDREYEDLIIRAKEAKTSDVREENLRCAMARALIRADAPPPFRRATLRGRVIAAIANWAAQAMASGAGACFKSIVYEFVDLGLNSKLVRRVEYSAHARLRRKSLWKVFRIPGRK